MNDMPTTAQLLPVLPREFGEGWMTNNARDLCKIAVTLGGFEADELVLRLAKAPSRGDRINAKTVENVLDAMHREAWPERYR